MTYISRTSSWLAHRPLDGNQIRCMVGGKIKMRVAVKQNGRNWLYVLNWPRPTASSIYHTLQQQQQQAKIKRNQERNPTCKSNVIKSLDWIGGFFFGRDVGVDILLYIAGPYVPLYILLLLLSADGMLYTCICESRIRFQPVFFFSYFHNGLPQFRRWSRSGYSYHFLLFPRRNRFLIHSTRA